MSKTLLLADDSVVIQKLVGLSFANEDVELITTDNGDDALTRAREVRPDLILADVVMPGKNGYEVCEAIKNDAALSHIPVLLLTGTFEAFDEDRARQVRSDGHITKPFEAQGLVDRVTDLLSRAPATPAAAPVAAPSPPPAPEPDFAIGTDGPPELRVAHAPAASGDGAYDFFDDDASEDLAAPDPVPAAPAPLASANPGSTFGFDSDLDLLATTDPTATEPDTLDTNFELDSDGSGDLTVAVVPAEPDPVMEAPVAPPPIPSDMNAPDATQIALGETRVQEDFSAPLQAEVASLDGSLSEPASSRVPIDAPSQPPPTPVQDPGQTRLTDDLFADPIPTPPPIPDISQTTDPSMPPAMDSGFEFGFDEPSTPDPTLDAPAPSAGADLGMDPAPDVSDPLEGMTPESPQLHDFGSGNPPEVQPPSLDDAADSTHSGYDVSTSDLGDPFATSADSLTPAAPATSEVMAANVDPDPASGPTAGTGPDLSPMMRDRIHETLEKIAWEAFADVSDSIVRQVLERVESIVWEVVPQMAEALIQEEIRRMKGS
jgi:CheY-like chemotaxis protein